MLQDNQNKTLQEQKETLRKLIGASICDLLSYLSSVKDPFIIGGQYKNNKLLDIVAQWSHDRKFSLEDANESTKAWLNTCQQGFYVGPKGVIEKPKKAQDQPKSFEKLVEDEYAKDWKEEFEEDGAENTPMDYYNGDDWKPEEEKKDRWQDEGEDWKKGFDGNGFPTT